MEQSQLDPILRPFAAGQPQAGMVLAERALADSPRPEADLVALLRGVLPRSREAAVMLVRRYGGEPRMRDALREQLVVARENGLLRDLLSIARTAGPAGAQAAADAVDAAVAANLAGDPRAALAHCERAIAIDGGHAPAWNHLGRARFHLGDGAGSEAAFRRAVELSPDYAAAWNNLGHVLRAAGKGADTAAAFARACRLDPDEPVYLFNHGTALLAPGSVPQALACFETVARIQPGNLEARENIAVCLQLLRRFDDARALYLALAPARAGDPGFLLRHARLEQEAGDAAQATVLLEAAAGLPAAGAEVHAELARALEQANALARAEAVVESALPRFPMDPELLLERAKLQRRRKAFAAARESLDAIDVQRLHPRWRQWLQHERALVLDALGDYGAAFQAFEACNGLAMRGMRSRQVDADYFDTLADAVLRWVREGAPVAAGQATDEGEGLCFLIGFPRSGTTLLDLFLDGHPAVAGIEEKPTVEALIPAVAAMPGGFPAALGAPGIDLARVRAVYRDAIAPWLPGDARPAVVVDKMPIRTLYAAFLHRVFPKAKFLFSLRHPCDVVLSNFMQHYAANEIFVHFYTLAESARTYARVMDIWQATQPLIPDDRVMTVAYESLVDDTAGTLERVCGFLGLDFLPDMLDRDRTLGQRGRIATNSYHQVSQPTYRHAMGRWRHYRAQMQPVLPVLEPHIRAFGYGLGE